MTFRRGLICLRDAEDAARGHFDRHGRWPDEPDGQTRTTSTGSPSKSWSWV